MSGGRIVKVSGPLVVAEGMDNAKMFDVVRVGDKRLIGEIIEMRDDKASIQVYEETSGIGPGQEVFSVGTPLGVELGPGMVGRMFDGIQRPLDVAKREYGEFIKRGMDIPSLNRDAVWHFSPSRVPGDGVCAGDILGTVMETSIVEHRIMVPEGVSGRITDIREGDYRVEDTVATVETSEGEVRNVSMLQRWPVRIGRPYAVKLAPDEPLVTGQRVIDTFFPVAKGGVACVPGPFGSGKTVVQHQLAKWADAEIVIYIGCGERGNEMTDVLKEFPQLKDPQSGKSLMERTVLVANTSNMPVAAREASIYTGITIAEYFRDMGYSVAVMADSTSRWAEALREMSGRLEEMPGEEGYPAYLASRIADFYERAGKVECLGGDGRVGAITVIGAVSPQGGDISEPVTQSTLKVVKVFWGLDANLAHKRHFPAINWLMSYSLYQDEIIRYFEDSGLKDWGRMVGSAMEILQREDELQQIVRLVGIDALSDRDRLTLEAARSIREDYLHQNAFHQVDTYTSIGKQYKMLKLILEFYDLALSALENGASFSGVAALPIREKIARVKYVPEERIGEIDGVSSEMERQIRSLSGEGDF